MEAENGDIAEPTVADRLTLVGAADGMRCILHDGKSVGASEVADFVHWGMTDRRDEPVTTTFGSWLRFAASLSFAASASMLIE